MSDLVIHAASRRIWRLSNKGTECTKPAFSRHDLIITFNYLDGIAVGVTQKVYSPEIVKDHMDSNFVKVVDVIMPAVIPRLIPDWSGYEALVELRNGWRTAKPTTYLPPH